MIHERSRDSVAAYSHKVTKRLPNARGATETPTNSPNIPDKGPKPPQPAWVNQDPAMDIDVVREKPRRMPGSVATTNSFGYGGQNAVLVLTAA